MRLKLGDEVVVINFVGNDDDPTIMNEYVGKEGVIIGIDEVHEYSNASLIDVEFSNGDSEIFRVCDLKLKNEVKNNV